LEVAVVCVINEEGNSDLPAVWDILELIFEISLEGGDKVLLMTLSDSELLLFVNNGFIV
jgi:hypothetical protein